VPAGHFLVGAAGDEDDAAAERAQDAGPEDRAPPGGIPDESGPGPRLATCTRERYADIRAPST
jgi:hypothetical protein